MDPARITPELVEEARSLCEGLVRSMDIEARSTGSKTKHGIRINVDAGESNHHLIGRDGESLAAIQYMVARMLRAHLREDSMPRIEVDVAGFREGRNEELREMARALMEEARRTGGEAVSEPLPAAERRVIHLEVAEAPGLTTVTIGEGEFKRVVVRTGEPEDAS
jgi:spoIIIJ-associated protein